jgi:hypothetical protein
MVTAADLIGPIEEATGRHHSASEAYLAHGWPGQPDYHFNSVTDYE